MSKNSNENKFIVDSLLAVEKEEKKIKKEEEVEMPEKNNPYKLEGKDEKYFKLFIGNNYDRITKREFNYAAFLFGGAYLVYRKSYLLGITWIIINLIFLILLPLLNVDIYIVLGIIFISHVACGYAANPSYINYVGTKIIEYRSKSKNDLKDVLITKGGTNILFASIVFLLSVGISGICLFDEIVDMNKYMINKTQPPINNGDSEIIINFKYDGILKENNEENIHDKISVPLLDGFQDLSSGVKYKYLYGENEILPKCMVEVSELSYRIDKSSFLKGFAKYHNELPENIKSYTANLEWNYLVLIDNTKETIYNVTEKNNKLYLLKVTYTSEYKDTCMYYYDTTIKGIE